MSAHPYSFFLNGWNPETDELTRQALDDFRNGSGLSPETLERAQVRIFRDKPEVLKKRLGFAQVDGQRITQSHRLIEFPYFDQDGTILRYEYKVIPEIFFKGQEKNLKYLQTKDEPPRPYILLHVWAAKDKLKEPLWITEGVKKILKLCQHGRLAVGVSGTPNWHAGKNSALTDSKDLWDDFKVFKMGGRTVFIAFDADLWTNPQVRRDLYGLAFTLHTRGATVKIPVWTESKGIDDFLILQSDPNKTLIELENQAKDLDGLIRTDHRDEIMKALYPIAGTRGVNERDLIEKVAKGLGQKVKDIKNDIERHHHNELKQTVDNKYYPYFLNGDGGISRWSRGRDGIEVETQLSNFHARITEDITIDTGLEVTRRFAIKGTTKDYTFPRILVPTAQFQNLNWAMNFWGNDGIIKAGQATRDYLREFIQSYSQRNGVQRRTVYGHTGWRQVNGGDWAYLMANGALGADGIDVELPSEFLETGRYCLPVNPESEKIRAGVDACFSFLDTDKPDIFFISLAYIFLAPLTSLLDPMPSFSLYFHGEKDTFKTAVAVLLLSFFGSHTKRALSNFDSTSNSIMHRAAILKDTLMIVDDYYPSPRAKDAQQKESIAQRIVRDLGNRTGRGRLNPDSTEKPIPSPRGLILITGEELPGLQSTLSRLVAVEFSQGDIDPANLTKLQAKASLLPHVMASYILWIRSRIESMQTDFDRVFSDLRGKVSIENKSRKIPEHVAYLQFAWDLFLTWTEETTGINKNMKTLASENAWLAFMRVAGRHAERIEGEDPVKLFFEIIGALLTQGKLRIDHKDGGYSGRIGGNSGEEIGRVHV